VKTAQKSHTTAWSEAFPIASVRNLLSPDELRIAIALQTDANIFKSTECRSGKFVDRLGLHGLSCIKNAGRFPRHSAINSILKRSLTRIGLSSVLEPVGLMRDRRPDGLTLLENLPALVSYIMHMFIVSASGYGNESANMFFHYFLIWCSFEYHN